MMPRGAKRAALAMALALAGCAAVDRAAPVVTANATARRGPGDEMLAYLARLRSMSQGELGAEAQRRRQAAARVPSDLASVKAALAMTLALQSDDGGIAELLEPVARRREGDREVRAMASFLLAFSAQRRRLRESATATQASLRDERRALEAQKERATQLQQKLEALSDLEKSLSERQPQTP